MENGLKNTVAAIPEGSTRRTYGKAYHDGTEWLANIDGNLLACRWIDPMQPLQGGNIVVDITNEGRGQYSALVIGGYTMQPRPSTGTITEFLPAGPSNRVVFTGDDGVSYTTDRAIGSYDLGDPIYVTWDAAKPTIIGKIAEASPPPVENAPLPPSPVASDTQRTPAAASDTWWGPGGWGSYATAQRGGEDLYTGSYYSGPVTGAWFYGAANTILAGRTITQARFRIPARLNAGSYNAAAALNLYAHTAQARPGGDVNRVVGPFTVTLPGGYNPATHSLVAGLPPGWVILPTDFHAVLASGGGISIAGGPYVGLLGRLKDPEAGKLEIDWSQS